MALNYNREVLIEGRAAVYVTYNVEVPIAANVNLYVTLHLNSHTLLYLNLFPNITRLTCVIGLPRRLRFGE